MSSSDRSRTSDDWCYHYKAVVAQQGRVIVDRDFNASETIAGARAEANALVMIGPAGTPDDGFAITVPVTSPVEAAGAPPFDFMIAAGTMYVGGQRVELPATVDGVARSWRYYAQPDWLQPDDPAPHGSPVTIQLSPPTSTEVVWLDAFEQEVGATEDPDLKEVCLGGPDTTARVRLMARVRRTPVHADDCGAAWGEATDVWSATEGLAFDPETMRLTPEVRLQVSFEKEPASGDPCDPVVQGGYLYAENQLIRIQVGPAISSGNSGNGTQSILWGYDDASFLYRAKVLSGGRQLQLLDSPPDAFHWPVSGQLIEILRTAAILGAATDPADTSAAIMRCVADASGLVRTLSESYGATSEGGASNFLSFDEPLPQAYLADPNPLFVRVWQTQLPYPADTSSIALTDASGASNGVLVTLTTPSGAPMTQGAFWMIALRPATPQAVYPERFLSSPQPPDGPLRWACPLATIDWSAFPPTVADCRAHFDDLVTLSQRHGGCCMLNIAPADLEARSLQQIVDGAAARSGAGSSAARICFAPGSYFLDAPLRLGAQHALMTFEGCNGEAILSARPGADAAAFKDGLVVVTGATRVTLSGMSFEPAGAPAPRDTQDLLSWFARTAIIEVDAWKRARQFEATRLLNDPSTVLPGIVAGLTMALCVRCLDSQAFTVEDCNFLVAPAPALRTGDVQGGNTLSMGLLVQGLCSGLTVRRCVFLGKTPSATVGLVASVADTPPAAAPAAPAPAAPVTRPIIAPAVNIERVDPETESLLRALPLQLHLAGQNFAAPVEPVAVGVGLLIAPSFSAGTLNRGDTSVTLGFDVGALLQNATISDNSFSRLTIGAASTAQSGLFRVADNSISDCVAGLWFAAWHTNALVFNVLKPVARGADLLLYGALLYEETFVGLFAPMCLSLPSGFTPRASSATTSGFSLVATGNDIDCRLSQAAQNAPSSFALGVFTDAVTVSPELRTTTLTVTSNRLQSNPPPIYPTLLAAFDGNLAMTGNHVVNGSTADGQQERFSLLIDPGSTAARDGSTYGLAVVGNVFSGATNLSAFPRPATIPVPFNNWDAFNAITS